MTSSHTLKGGVSLDRKVYKGIIPYYSMENTNQNDVNATESIGVTEMQETWEDHQPSFYDIAEQNGTLMYYQCDGDGNDIKAEDY